jgi:hypothetical protein
MAKKITDVMEKENWDSLTQLKRHIEETGGKEKVVSFMGHTLTTNKYVYGLSSGKLSRVKK